MKYNVNDVLPKEQHEYWQEFVKKHHIATVNYIYSILGSKVEDSEFFQVYHNFHPMSKTGNYQARKLLRFLKKIKWIK